MIQLSTQTKQMQIKKGEMGTIIMKTLLKWTLSIYLGLVGIAVAWLGINVLQSPDACELARTIAMLSPIVAGAAIATAIGIACN